MRRVHSLSFNPRDNGIRKRTLSGCGGRTFGCLLARSRAFEHVRATAGRSVEKFARNREQSHWPRSVGVMSHHVGQLVPVMVRESELALRHLATRWLSRRASAHITTAIYEHTVTCKPKIVQCGIERNCYMYSALTSTSQTMFDTLNHTCVFNSSS